MKEFLEYAKSKGVKEIDVDVLCVLSGFLKKTKSEQFSLQGVVHSKGVDKQEFLSNESDIIEEHGCPFQEDVNGDYDFKCNCNDEDTHQCAMDV